MKFSEKLNSSRSWKLLAAVLLNAVFLVIVIRTYALVFSINDDVYLQLFVNGAFSTKDIHIPFANVFMGVVLKLLYSVFGSRVPCYTILLYGMLFSGLTALTYAIMEKYGTLHGGLVATVLLLLFGTEAYARITFTVCSGICVIAGMYLLFISADQLYDGKQKLFGAETIIGIVLCIFGTLRKQFFLPLLALSAIPGVKKLLKMWNEEDHKNLGKKFFLYCTPFLVMICTVLCLKALDRLAWKNDMYADWETFSVVRVDMKDYLGLPDYWTNPEEFEKIDMSENDEAMMKAYLFSDREFFTTERLEDLRAICQLQNENRMGLSMILVEFFKNMFFCFLHKKYAQAVLIAGLIWLLTNEYDRASVFSAALWVFGFSVMYMMLIYKGRYGFDRVDSILLVTGFMAFVMTAKPCETGMKTAILSAAVLAALFLNIRVTSAIMLRGEETEKVSNAVAVLNAMETLNEEKDYVFIMNDYQLAEMQWMPFETLPEGMCDRLIINWGWAIRHPAVTRALESNGISNVYRDCVDRSDVLWVNGSSDTIVRYIQEHYCPEAKVEIITELSQKTGMDIYRISR